MQYDSNFSFFLLFVIYLNRIIKKNVERMLIKSSSSLVYDWCIKYHEMLGTIRDF